MTDVELAVELYGTRVAVLRGPDWRAADLAFTPDALDRWGVNSPVLSVAAPLEVRPRRARAERRRNVLAEMLPEGPMRVSLARVAGVPDSDVPGLLARFGRDIAGAAQVYDPRAPWEPPTPELIPVDDAAIARLLDALNLGNHLTRGKTSLAGVQPKIVLALRDGRWHQPVGGAPSTHIVKPALPGRGAALAEEEFGHRLATALGLCRTSATLQDLGGRECLVVERYDRDGDVRVHQEDFNQALGLSGDQKYQETGGHARLRRVAEVVAQHAPADLDRLAAHVIVAVAIGNLDLHAKNLSLLHPADGSTALAPAYDMVPLAHLPGVDGRLAMAVDGEYRHAAVTLAHLEGEVASWRADPGVVRRTLSDLHDLLGEHEPRPDVAPVRDAITRCTGRLLSGHPIGNAFTG